MSLVPRRVSVSSQDKPPSRAAETLTPMKPFPISTATHNTNNLNNEWAVWEPDSDLGTQQHHPNGASTFENRGVVGMVPGTLQLTGDNAMSPAGQVYHRPGVPSPPMPVPGLFPVPQGAIPPPHLFPNGVRSNYNFQNPSFPVPLTMPGAPSQLGNYASSPIQSTPDQFPRGMPVEDDGTLFPSRSPAVSVSPPTNHLALYGGFPLPDFNYYVPPPDGSFVTYQRLHSHPPFALPHLSGQGPAGPFHGPHPPLPQHQNIPGSYPNGARFPPAYPIDPGLAPPMFFYGSPTSTHLSPGMQMPAQAHCSPHSGSLNHRGKFRDTSPNRRANDSRQPHGPSTPGRNAHHNANGQHNTGNRFSHNRSVSMSDGNRHHGVFRREERAPDPSPLLMRFRADMISLGAGPALAAWKVKASHFDLKNHIPEFATDQHGSRLIQAELTENNTEDRDWIFDEIVPMHFHSLMLNVFGNYVIQKLFEHGSDSQKQALVEALERRVVEYSFNIYACRVVQAALTHITPAQHSILIARLHDHVLRCIRDAQGNHVVQKLIETVDPRRLTFLQTICDNIRDLSSHAYGCRVLQRCLAYLKEDAAAGILDAIHRHTLDFVQDQFGNYVIQYIITSGREADKERVISKISDNLIKLSQQKFASNVCEKALAGATPEVRRKLIDRILNSQMNGQPATSAMIKHQYANYVLQTAIKLAESEQLELLLDRVHPVVVSLRKAATGHNKPLENVEKIVTERLAQQAEVHSSKAKPEVVITVEDTDKE